MAMEQARESAREAAHAVSEFFQGNPFSTRVGQMIEQATDTSLASENWALNMEICDAINNLEEGPRDAVRAIRKRLQTTMGKNNQTVMFALTVLETSVKNCDYRLHILVAQKEFAQELVKLIGPKYDAPQIVQEKVLGLIQAWAHAFRGKQGLNGVCEVYDELKSKGLEFPVLDPNAAPIFVSSGVPEHHMPLSNPTLFQQHTAAYHQQQQQQHNMPIQAMAIPLVEPVNPSSEQLAKLRSELDLVGNNLKVLREMLTELAPGHEDKDDLELLHELYATCRQMQSRVLELLERVSNEEVTSELLLMNDELNNVFSKYDRYMANRKKEQEQRGNSQEPAAAPLIDLGGGSAAAAGHAGEAGDLNRQMAGLNVGASTVGHHHQQQPDLVAVPPTGATAAGGPPAVAPVVKDSDAKEMEAWLQQQGGDAQQQTTGQPANQEFQQFLNQRADAGGQGQ